MSRFVVLLRCIVAGSRYELCAGRELFVVDCCLCRVLVSSPVSDSGSLFAKCLLLTGAVPYGFVAVGHHSGGTCGDIFPFSLELIVVLVGIEWRFVVVIGISPIP